MINKTRRIFWSTTIGALVTLAIIIAVATAFPSLFHFDLRSFDPSNHNGAQIVQVEAYRVEKKTLHPSLDLVGQIVAIPEHTAVISSQAGGWIEKVNVVEGQMVRAGDILLELDSHLAKSELLRAKAKLAEKRAALARLKQGNLPEEIDAARQERDGMRAKVEGLQTELSALKDLVDRKEYSPVQYQTKQKELETGQATLAAAEAKLKLMERGTRPEVIAEAQAQVDAAAADMKAAELAVSWCTIRSPSDGVVVQLAARRGQFLDRAALLARIDDLSELFAQIRIPSDALAVVKIGTAVDVRIDALPNKDFRGQVARLSGEADPLSGNLTAYVSIKNLEGLLKPGLACKARVWLPEIAEAIAVPISAIADHAGTPVVTVIRDGKATEVPVTVGVRTERFAQIIDGLSTGDVVATKGGYGLPEGCPVEIVSNDQLTKQQ